MMQQVTMIHVWNHLIGESNKLNTVLGHYQYHVFPPLFSYRWCCSVFLYHIKLNVVNVEWMRNQRIVFQCPYLSRIQRNVNINSINIESRVINSKWSLSAIRNISRNKRNRIENQCSVNVSICFIER